MVKDIPCKNVNPKFLPYQEVPIQIGVFVYGNWELGDCKIEDSPLLSSSF